MAPNVTSSPTEGLCTPENILHSSREKSDGVEKPALKYRTVIVWPYVVLHIYLNVAALYGVYLMLTSAKVLTGIWGMCKRLYVLYSSYICKCIRTCIKVSVSAPKEVCIDIYVQKVFRTKSLSTAGRAQTRRFCYTAFHYAHEDPLICSV